MTDATPPIDRTLWGKWVRDGDDRWKVVSRSWIVFARNSQELTRILDRPRVDIGFSFELMRDRTEITNQYWDEVDQRLHNALAAAVSLVDHTRRLLEYLESDVPDVIGEYKIRNGRVLALNETRFLRDLRNYLLHFGVAPIFQSMSLGPQDGDATGHSIKLNSQHLLEWRKWSMQSRDYLSTFAKDDGPQLMQDVVTYATAMHELFQWLFSQKVAIFNDERVLNRFRVEHS